MEIATATGGGQATSRTTTTVSTQRFVRQLGGVSPYVWRGLLPSLGMLGVLWFGLFPFASNDIEAQVASEVRHQLELKGFGWVSVAVSGQEVLLSGTPPRAGAGDDALAQARAATCPTWAGPKVCAVTVLGAFGAPAVPAATAPAAPVVAAPSAAPSVPALSAEAVACEAAFAKKMLTSRIEFASGGSAIDERSARLLDQLAQAAGACPGKVLIEGHTDNVGDAASNQRLSEARAEAVRQALVQRGVPAARLLAAGHGQSKPLAGNDTVAGRAANRRIEFKAVP